MHEDLGLSDKQHEIIETALILLSEKGFNELSMRDIAKKMNVKAPAIYWHFKNKAVLVDYMAEYILRNEMGDFSPRESEQSWQDWVIYHISLLRKAMLSYPDGGRVVAGAHLFPAVTLAKVMEYSLESLYSAKVDTDTAQSIVLATIHYTFGYVIEEQADTRPVESPSPDQISRQEQHDAYFTFSQYPHLSRIMEFTNTGKTSDENFMDGLNLIILGGSKMAAQKSERCMSDVLFSDKEKPLH